MLSDAEKRQQYDRYGFSGPSQGLNMGGFGFEDAQTLFEKFFADSFKLFKPMSSFRNGWDNNNMNRGF